MDGFSFVLSIYFFVLLMPQRFHPEKRNLRPETLLVSQYFDRIRLCVDPVAESLKLSPLDFILRRYAERDKRRPLLGMQKSRLGVKCEPHSCIHVNRHCIEERKRAVCLSNQQRNFRTP